MDKYLNTYLDKVDRYLKSMPASERADIINEIKSEMAELEVRESLSPEQIVERLGAPGNWQGHIWENQLPKALHSVSKGCVL